MTACSTCGFEAQATFRFCPECGDEPVAEPPSYEQRKTVTVLFCDLTGSTALGEQLDPERLRSVLARYFDEMKAIVERHGGSVEKFIGDAVMAVFGVPVLHEDDAQRAVRAAVEMREALPTLGLQGRIGVMTGEVVTGTAERLVTGDAVNVAARLEQAAQPGEVLIGRPTLALARDAVDIEPVEPLALKGKSESVPAYRLIRVLAEPERRHDTPFVGRRPELALLSDAWTRVQDDSCCELVTIVGDAGVGKSRLVAEFLSSIEATVVRGRCLPYGEGITYWPVVEVLKQLTVLPPNDVATTAIRALLGESSAVTSAEEIAWAVRKTLEHAARGQPLIVVFDDIQWGEQIFHDLIEHIALLSTGAAILLLCMGRPELTEHNPTWPVTARLTPLVEAEVDVLIPPRIAADLRVKIIDAAGGNPLFVAEMLVMAAESDGDVIVPPTLQALLAARLDQLELAERQVLEWGSIEGEIFHRGAIQALAPLDVQVTPRLAALVRKQLIRPDRPQIEGDDGFRFRHLLLRDAAYEAQPKAVRANLHERYAKWVERSNTGLIERDEIIGHHLEQAYRFRAELGWPDDDVLGAAARRHLTAASRRAARRHDHDAVVEFSERVSELMPPPEIDLFVETMLIDALYWKGDGEAALRRADALAERGAASGDDVAKLAGEIHSGFLRLSLDSNARAGPLRMLVEQARPFLEATQSDIALFVADNALAFAEFGAAQLDTALAAFERAASHAARAGLPHELLGWRAICVTDGRTPLDQALEWFEANESRAGSDSWFRGAQALALAMRTRIDEGRTILADTRAELADRGGGIVLATLTGIESAMLELLADDPAAAAAFASEGCQLLEALGDVSFLSSAAATHAAALYELGRIDEAAAWAERSAELGSSDDAYTQIAWRLTHAKVLARRGQFAEAERVARDCVSRAEATGWWVGQGQAHISLADVLLMNGNRHEAATALEEALQRSERKGNLVAAQHTRVRLAELQDTTTTA